MKKEYLGLEYYIFDNLEELDKKDKELVKNAIDASTRAYAPYSKFHVGAAVRLSNDIIIQGNNQENAAYPSGLCAERVTLFYAHSRYPNEVIVTIAIYANNEDNTYKDIVTPCGACRQVMAEIQSAQKKPLRVILLSPTNSGIILPSIDVLLPFQFEL
ncbi:MAG: cytidine deaminase [Bacteroidales bacterium]|jgi:cytidine deaminase|nr:cytidine deaminase [Bacteroidales bacterium]MDI9576055.1 cytidine deaminase [Bacteroidota bacterium]MDD2593223.1 cytidine deaminase [Bacteroidales bacterium]MDD3754935.1 cytidine deaminase [Bacteroidales bacterium]MDY0400285.1 cytidine deaminase [Bacteroidales bacterium]